MRYLFLIYVIFYMRFIYMWVVYSGFVCIYIDVCNTLLCVCGCSDEQWDVLSKITMSGLLHLTNSTNNNIHISSTLNVVHNVPVTWPTRVSPSPPWPWPDLEGRRGYKRTTYRLGVGVIESSSDGDRATPRRECQESILIWRRWQVYFGFTSGASANPDHTPILWKHSRS